MIYTDSRGNKHRLTRTQRHYLERLDVQGRIKSGPGFRSTQTARLLQERGLVAHLYQYGPGDWTMSTLTDLGREVLYADRLLVAVEEEMEHVHRAGGAIGCHHCRELTRDSGSLTEDDYAYVRRLSESWSTRGEDNTFLKLVNAYDALKTDLAALRAEVGVQVGANSVLLDALRAIASDGCRSPSAQRADEWICLDDWPDVPEEWCAGCVAHLVA